MIDFIKGEIDYIEDNQVVINCNGVGYSVVCSSNAVEYANRNLENAKLYTYMSVSDAGIFLYGFHSILERKAFNLLISVPKVGPKVAISVLSMFIPKQLVEIVLSSDSKSLSMASGVGKKLAENIIFVLKDKIEKLFDGELYEAVEMQSDEKDEAISALSALGFDNIKAYNAVSAVFKSGMSVDELLITALQYIEGNK